jgi:protocatechuate 3,4-dioxygenase beta subunit
LTAAGSCRGARYTAPATGAYAFATEVPGSFGPPQHLHVRVSAPGFVTLTTTVKGSPDLAFEKSPAQAWFHIRCISLSLSPN